MTDFKSSKYRRTEREEEDRSPKPAFCVMSGPLFSGETAAFFLSPHYSAAAVVFLRGFARTVVGPAKVLCVHRPRDRPGPGVIGVESVRPSVFRPSRARSTRVSFVCDGAQYITG